MPQIRSCLSSCLQARSRFRNDGPKVRRFAPINLVAVAIFLPAALLSAPVVSAAELAAEYRIAHHETMTSRPALLRVGSTREIDTNKFSTYAVVLGRATGCGENVDGPLRRVGSWLDSIYRPGSPENQMYLMLLAEGMRHNAVEQRAGRSPDSCAQVRRTLNGFPWP